MDDSESEAAETEPLVQRGPPQTQSVGGGVGGGGTVEGSGRGSRGVAGGSGGVGGSNRLTAPPPAPSASSNKPRLSLVPEASEKSLEDDQGEEGEGNGGGSGRGGGEGIKGSKKFLESPTPLCPFFGVRNYLHQFYEREDISNPALYEDPPPGEHIWLVKQTEGGCSSSVFRLSLLLGGLLLLLGVVAFVVAACAARRTVIVAQGGGVSMVDRAATSHNAQVDALLLVGLVAVTLGSTVVAASLISRTFCSRPEEYPDPFRMGQYVIEPPSSPTDKKVPVTERLTQVQPVWGLPSYSSVKGIIPLP